MSKLALKFIFGEEIRRTPIDGCPSFKVLSELTRELFAIEHFSLKYEDEEGDLVTVKTDLEVEEAVRVATKHFNSVLRIHVVALASINKENPSPSKKTNMAESASSQELIPRILELIGVRSSGMPKHAKSSKDAKVDKAVVEEAPISPVTPLPPKHKGVNIRVTCDMCQISPIVGDGFECVVCENFDLCGGCFKKNCHKHAHESFRPIFYCQMDNSIPVLPLQENKPEDVKANYPDQSKQSAFEPYVQPAQAMMNYPIAIPSVPSTPPSLVKTPKPAPIASPIKSDHARKIAFVPSADVPALSAPVPSTVPYNHSLPKPTTEEFAPVTQEEIKALRFLVEMGFKGDLLYQLRKNKCNIENTIEALSV